MTYTSDVIKNAVAQGYAPDCISGKKIVRMYICPECKGISRIKFRKKGDVREACKCGYRKQG